MAVTNLQPLLPMADKFRAANTNASSSAQAGDRINSMQSSYPQRKAQPSPVVIESIATGVPERSMSQGESARRVVSLFDSNPEQQKRIPRIYEKTQIQNRHMVVDPLCSEFSRDMLIRQRMDLFLDHATALAVDVSRRALAQAYVARPLEDIGLLVLVTSTGFVAPGVDVGIMKALGLSPSISRVVVNFMGCAAAMNGLRAAADFVRSNGMSKALVCCVEISSVNAVFADNINDVIISSLFADGCAAMVVGPYLPDGIAPAPGQIVIQNQFHQFVDGTLDGITLGVNHDGITCELSPSLPLYIRNGLDPVISSVLERLGKSKSDIDCWAIHPGGPKIIEESVRSLGLAESVAKTSWEVLSQYGNMLSASLPFVLQRMVADARLQRPACTGVAFSFAPGVTVEGMVFDIVGVRG